MNYEAPSQLTPDNTRTISTSGNAPPGSACPPSPPPIAVQQGVCVHQTYILYSTVGYVRSCAFLFLLSANTRFDDVLSFFWVFILPRSSRHDFFAFSTKKKFLWILSDTVCVYTRCVEHAATVYLDVFMHVNEIIKKVFERLDKKVNWRDFFENFVLYRNY